MKKLFIFILSIFLFFPINIYALEIKETTIIGKENITVGEPFTESILISFDELEKNIHQSVGILYIKYEISFDHDILSPISIESPDWNTIMYQEDDKYYILSIVNTENRYQNNCYNSFLYCGDYRATVEFYPNNVESSNSQIIINNIELATLDIIKETEYTLEDIMLQTAPTSTNYNIAIKSSELASNITQPTDIIADISPEDIQEKILEALSQEPLIVTESSNYLSDLKITGYEIEFNKYKNDYTIKIPSTETNLDISVITENPQATYKITGNNNLTNKPSQVIIEVTSTNGEINTYSINVERKNIDNLQLEEAVSKQKLSFKEIIVKYQIPLKYAAIILAIILIITIIIKIISKIKDKKIEEMTNKF